jgi:hypothetical protein
MKDIDILQEHQQHYSRATAALTALKGDIEWVSLAAIRFNM